MSIVVRLNDKQLNGHRLRQIPHPLDDVIVSVIDAYRNAAPSLRQTMLAEMTAKPAGVLCISAERLTAVAVRTPAVQPLHQALLAVGIAVDALDDFRDHLYPLAAVCLLDLSKGNRSS